MKPMLTFILLLALSSASAQQNEERAIKSTINKLFDGMRLADSSLLKEAFAPNAYLQTIVASKDGNVKVRNESLHDFITAVSKPRDNKYDECIILDRILVDDQLARFGLAINFTWGSIQQF